MDKLETLRTKVADLYATDLPGRADWADWLYSQHVKFVAAKAREIAATHGADPELSEISGLLHDIADIKMTRKDAGHAEESLKIAREVMEECGYSKDQIELVVDDAIRFHSCHGDEHPESLEGKVLATADALAHLKTDFHIYASVMLGREMSLEELKQWTLAKIDRDLNRKIFFDDIRESVRPDYEVIKNLFSRAPVK